MMLLYDLSFCVWKSGEEKVDVVFIYLSETA